MENHHNHTEFAPTYQGQRLEYLTVAWNGLEAVRMHRRPEHRW